MRRTVVVTMTKRVDVEIHDAQLTPESLSALSTSAACDVESAEDLFSYVAGQYVMHDDHYLEGIGRAATRSRMRLVSPAGAASGLPASLVLCDIFEHATTCEVLPLEPQS